MKKITTIIYATVLALSMPGMSIAQGGIENGKGYELSKKEGIMSRLMRWLPGAQQIVPVYDPQGIKLKQMGVRKEQLTTMNIDYDFYGGTNDKGTNIPMAAVTDAAGNTYVTGGSSNEGHAAGDLFTIKVSPSGAILWETRLEAAQYAVEYGLEILLDSNGGLILTGISWNGSNTGIRTIKYNIEDGSEVWQSVFEGEGNGADVPTAMATDADGNIYIAGMSWTGEVMAYATLKYDTNGIEVWNVLHEDGEWNEATAITTDAEGNVIVTGYNPDNDGWANYHTVKYNAEGEEMWVQTYNYPSTDPANPSPLTNSIPRAVTTDAVGNVYVTGEFDTFLGRFGTIKYTANGEQEWIETYKSGTDRTQAYNIAVKGTTLYVAGTHRGGFSNDGNVLISYNLDGTQNWYAESIDLIDPFDSFLMFDGDNPVVAAFGMTQGEEEWSQDHAFRAKKFSPEGDLLGEAASIIVFDGTAGLLALAGAGLDASGDIYFSGHSFYSEAGDAYEVIRAGFAETAPAPQWNTLYTNLGMPNAGMLYSFHDNNGGTLATGRYYNFDDGMLNANYFVVKHNSEGDIAWEKVYNAENGNPANGLMARADADGNIYVALLPDFDITAITIKKLSPAGNELWETELELTFPQVYVMEPGPDVALYLGGTAYENAEDSSSSFVAVKLNSAGDEVWTAYAASPDNADNVYAINAGKVNGDGNFILTGLMGTGTMMSQDVDLTAVKFNNDGTVAWINKVPVTGVSSSGTDLLLDTEGAVYINGFTQSQTNGEENMLTAKLSAEGEVMWSSVYGEPNRWERSYTLKQFSNGDIAVAGYSLAMSGDINNVLVRYNGSGEEVWDFASGNMRYYNDFHIDGSDDCYIMNQVIVNPMPDLLFSGYFPIASLVKVDSEGAGAEEFFIGPEHAQFFGERLIAHADNRLLLGGSLNNQSYYEGVYYFETEHDGTLGSKNPRSIEKSKNLLGQNYPNPVVAGTDIPFYLAEGGRATIKLYNSQGRFIKDIADADFSAGDNKVHFEAAGLARGIYFYQIASGKFRQARKMVVTN